MSAALTKTMSRTKLITLLDMDRFRAVNEKGMISQAGSCQMVSNISLLPIIIKVGGI